MLAAKPSPYLTRPLRVLDSAAWKLAPPVLHGSQEEAAKWRAWRKILETLRGWEQNPAQLEDEGVEAPDMETIQAAILLAESYQALELPPPDHVVCDPNGDIVLRRSEGGKSEELHLSADGREYRFFDGARLVERRRI
jgi:hypothetical protein